MTHGPWRKTVSLSAAQQVQQVWESTNQALGSTSGINSGWLDVWGPAAGLTPVAAADQDCVGGWLWGSVNKPASGAELNHLVLRLRGADNPSNFNTQPMEFHTQLLNRTSFAFNDNDPNFGKGVWWGPIFCPTRFARIDILNGDHASQTIDAYAYAGAPGVGLGAANGLARQASRSAGWLRDSTLGIGAIDNGPIWCIDPHWDWNGELANLAALGGTQLVQHVPYGKEVTWAADITGNANGDALTVRFRYGPDLSVNPLPYIAEEYQLVATANERVNSEDLTRYAAVAGTVHFPSQVEGPFAQVQVENTGATALTPCIRSFRLHARHN